MGHTHQARQRRLTAAATLAAVGVALLASLAIAAHSAGEPEASGAGGVACPSSGAVASDATVQQLRRSVRCLINEERGARDLPALGRVSTLQTAAKKHSKVMAATDCLAHRCPGEGDLDARVRKAGYLEGAETWGYAENTGCGLSAEAMVANWLGSAFHRDNLFDREFHELGVGVTQRHVEGRCDEEYATFALVVGWRQYGA